jgi:hypothetical protein
VVGACTEATLELIEHPLDPKCLHRSDGQCIDPRCSTIGSDPLPRLFENVVSIDAVIEGVESPTL